ncbi:hypothetical protein C3B58_06960 [Lactonifactor longoviformis]|uniref:Anti-sigma factor RsgI-like middle domain-containing protein n=1 Tax=Lactonifactor longoviformis DSM 17459 TaxID=1122155 RepID=A0A1M4Z3R8_9CLOT|nr:hypothetical protein [Lactonifactor longoviformis]POP33556.1 hypothetical protein C3B58_06960 [Lactonifactor longoviformis]SHF12660.1 hypothetical protein SAMN02745158_02627 [Lactonifactor longoviformis DSM 17459]
MANRIHDMFEPVKASEELKESTAAFLQAERRKRTAHFFRPAVYRTIAAVCVMLMLLAGIGGYSVMGTPVSYVSIDVNPSVELALNRFDRVVSATAYNEDGEVILEGLAVKGKKYTEAIDLILDSADKSAYLTPESDLVFTVAAKNREKKRELRTGIENCSGCMEHGGESISADIGTVTEAHHHGVSLGKYSAYLKLSQYDETVTVEDCRDMTMSDIHHQIKEHEQGGKHRNGEANETDDGDSSGSPGKTHRNGHHNGNHE